LRNIEEGFFMSDHFFDLDGNSVTQQQWAKIFRSGKGRLKKTILKEYDVFTSWTGLGFIPEEEKPMIYETMVFLSGTYTDVFSERYATKDEALEAHEGIVERANSGEFGKRTE